MMEAEPDDGYSLKFFTKKFTLPQQVRVVSGIYDMLDEISLSREEILTLHSLKKYETVRATTYEGHTFYLPLNITSKVAVIASRGSPQISYRRTAYEDVESLADDFPPLVASMERHKLLDIEEGDILKPIQTWKFNPREGSLQCSILNKPLSNDVFLPLSYQAKFKTLETTHYNALFLKEVVTNYPLPVQVRFLENRVLIRKHDLNSGKPISIESLGIITLLNQSDVSLVVATTMDSDTGQVQSLLTLPQDMDITVAHHRGSSKKHKRKSKPLEVDFCDKNFVYGSTVIEEKPLNDAEVQGYEEILPRLFPRKKPGAPSRFHRNLRFLDDRNGDSRQGNNLNKRQSYVQCQGTSNHDNGNSFHGDAASYQDDNASQAQNENCELNYAQLDLKKATSNFTQNSTRATRSTAHTQDGYIDMSESINIAQELKKYKASVKYDRREDSPKPYHVKPEDKYVNMSNLLLQESKVKFVDYGSKAEVDGPVELPRRHYPRTLTSTRSAWEEKHADDGISNDADDVDDNNDDGGSGGDDNVVDDEHHHDDDKLDDICDVNGAILQRTYSEGSDKGLPVSNVFQESPLQNQQHVLTNNRSSSSSILNLQRSISESNNSSIPGSISYLESSIQNLENPPQTIASTSQVELERSISEGNGNGTNVFHDNSHENLEPSSQTNTPTAHRLSNLKRLKQQHFSLASDQKENTSEKRPILKERRRSDLEGYKIPSRPLSMNEQQLPRVYMRPRTLTDLFQYKAEVSRKDEKNEDDKRKDLFWRKTKTNKKEEKVESINDGQQEKKNGINYDDDDGGRKDYDDDDGNDAADCNDGNDDDESRKDYNIDDQEETSEDSGGHLRVIRGERTTSISVKVPDDFEHIYRRPAPTPPLSPPHFNTLSASFSKRSKSKDTRKGSLRKLPNFARKGITRAQSDSSGYSYVDCSSIVNVRADKLTEIGKIWDFRKSFEKKKKSKSKDKSSDELTRDQRLDDDVGRKFSRDGIQSSSDRSQSCEQRPNDNTGKDRNRSRADSNDEVLHPRDRLRSLDVEEISKLLQQLSLHRYVEYFKEAKIDGSMFVDLNEEMLIELHVDKVLDRRKIRKTIEEGWLPKVK